MIYFGASQWGYSNWVGSIYPEKTPPGKYLYYYAQKFNTVEVNPFYHDIVEINTIKRWQDNVGKDFRFCPKFPKTISHDKLLYGTADLTTDFLNRLSLFKENLGVSFLQLHPDFAPSEIEVLDSYLKSLPAGFKVAVELKPYWIEYDEIRTAALKVLAENNAGIVILDTKDTMKIMNKYKLTNHSAMIRFNCYGFEVDKPRIDNWIKMISKWNVKGLPEIYFFLHFPEANNDFETLYYAIEQFDNNFKN